MPEVLVIAGEASGDLHGAGLVKALGVLRPEWRFAGLGGVRMQEAGVTLLEDAEHLAVMGFVEVLRQVPQHYLLLRQLERRMADGDVKLVVVIDYPGFNMRVAAAAQRCGVPVLYYITPQVWAWGAGRLPRLAKLITRAACILPFEAPLLQQHGIDATFVGHPLLDRALDLPARAEARASLGVAADTPLLVLFPGSRTQEIHRHLEAFVETGRRLQARIPSLEVRVAVAPTIRLDASAVPFPLVGGASFALLRAADAALCKSGTTTLEAAVAGCPHIVAYRTSRWTYAIARRVVTIPRIGLVNVVAGTEVAPEFVQERAVPDLMVPALAPLLDRSSPQRARMVEALGGVRDQLGSPGAARRTAEVASAMVV